MRFVYIIQHNGLLNIYGGDVVASLRKMRGIATTLRPYLIMREMGVARTARLRGEPAG